MSDTSSQRIDRSCHNCDRWTVCFAAKAIRDVVKDLRVNIDTNDAPKKIGDVFQSLAGCCFQFKERAK